MEVKPFFKELLKGGPVTVLQIIDNRFVLKIIDSNASMSPAAEITAGDNHTVLEILKHEPAQSIELEMAIETIEDQLIPIIRDLPEHRRLVTSEPPFLEIADTAGLNTDDPVQMHVDQVEEVFNRIVDVAYGTPPSVLNIPVNRSFSSALLFLRELMHHAGYSSLILCK